MELRSIKRAAEHFDVSPGCARALLASRGIHRISGYPASAVRGRRTDNPSEGLSVFDHPHLHVMATPAEQRMLCGRSLAASLPLP